MLSHSTELPTKDERERRVRPCEQRDGHITWGWEEGAPGLPNHTGHSKALWQRQTGGTAQGAMSVPLLMSAIIIIMTMAASHPLSVCFKRPISHSCTTWSQYFSIPYT